MYYMKTMEDKVRVPPNLFGSSIDDAVLHILRDKYERRLMRDIGLLLCIEKAEPVGQGIIIPGDGGAYYRVRFEALSFIPFVNEVYEAEIKEIVEFGAFCVIGPLQGLLHISQISKDKFSYDKKSKTLSSRAEKKSIKKGDSVMVKVSTVSLKATTTETKIGLTMRPEGLGKHEWFEAKSKKKEASEEKPKKEAKEKKAGEK